MFDAFSQGLHWATGSTEGIAFVEWLILCAMVFMYFEIRKLRRWQETHEKECAARERVNDKVLADGSKTMALQSRDIAEVKADIAEIKETLKG